MLSPTTRVVNGYSQPRGRGQEEIRIGLRIPHLIASDDWRLWRDVQGFQRERGARRPSAGGDGRRR
jgi:hypothetical protein